MKTREQIQDRLNQLIDYAGAETPGDHAKLAAILLSSGGAFGRVGAMTRGQMEYCVEQGRRAEQGQSIGALSRSIRSLLEDLGITPSGTGSEDLGLLELEIRRLRLAHYGKAPSTGHVFNFVQASHEPDHEQQKLPAHWYDGTPKRCPGSGEFPRAMRTGEDQDHGQGYEHVYLSRCLYCNKPLPPSERAANHTFVPVRPDQSSDKV